MEGRQARHARDDRAHGDAHADPHLLSQLQVRLLAVHRPGAARARGARARLLLYRVVRPMGRVGGPRPRNADGVGTGVARRARAERGAALAVHDTRAAHRPGGPRPQPSLPPPPRRGTGPGLGFSEEQLTALQPFYVLEQKTVVKLGTIATTLDPQLLGRQYRERADIVVLQAIKDQERKRPFYFSRTVGLYADQMGLTA